MPGSSSSTGSRPSRSSGSMLRTRSMRALPSCSSLADGTVSTGRPVAAAWSMALRRRAGEAPGSATMTCVAPARTSGRVTSAKRAEHGDPADPRVALDRVVVEQAEHDPALVVDRREQALGGLAGAHHQRAPHVRVAAGDARAGMLVEHAVRDAHHAHAHQGDERMERQHRARHLGQPGADDPAGAQQRRPRGRPGSAA